MLKEFTKANDKNPFGQFEYTNFGYVVISMILEKELQKPWQDILAATVFQPAGMEQTSAYISDAEKYNWALAKPYTQRNRENKLQRISLEKKDNTMHAAGGIISTARDLARFLIAQINHGKINEKQVFPAKLIEQAQKAQVKQSREYFDMHRFAYGFGWNLATVPSGDTLIHHYGGYAGAHAQVAFMPQNNIGVAVMTNENNQGQDLAYLLASYAFDYLSGNTDIDSVYSAKLDTVKAHNDRWLQRILAQEEERAKRSWQLELPFEAYQGSYENNPMGTLIVSNLSDSILTAELGNLKSAPAEPFTRPNSIPVEIIPGNGSVLQFGVNDGKVESATLNGMIFTKEK